MLTRLLGISLVALTAAGCSGTIISQANQSACLTGRCDGVVYYQLVPSTTTYYYDKILDKDGAVLHWSGAAGEKRCIPVKVEQTTMVPASVPSLLSYDPGFLETSKFTVGLTPNGTLASVGAESTPGAKMASDALTALASSIKTVTESGVFTVTSKAKPPYCSSGQVPERPALGPDSLL